MKLVTVNGINFEVMNTKTNPYSWGKSDIYELYQRPSAIKVAIWEDWLNFFRNLGYIDTIRVHGNCMMFSIVADIVSKDGNRYNFYITKAHNKVYIF